VFESASSSVYNGGTLSIRRHMTQRNLRSYTFAHAVDDGQDALVAGRPATVQNSYAPNSEKGPCVTDQRHRFAFFYVFAPWPFHRDHEWLARMFNNWKTSGVVTFGSGRPISATVTGNANQDGNSSNDRLPEFRAILWLDLTTPPRACGWLGRILRSDKVKLELMAESFNLLNRDNQRVQITQDGFITNSAQFVQTSKFIGINYFPAQYRTPTSFRRATDAYAPRLVKLGLKLIY
jgi:hypothetical protein